MNDGDKGGGMSAELQAIMQKRRAKSSLSPIKGTPPTHPSTSSSTNTTSKTPSLRSTPSPPLPPSSSSQLNMGYGPRGHKPPLRGYGSTISPNSTGNATINNNNAQTISNSTRNNNITALTANPRKSPPTYSKLGRYEERFIHSSKNNGSTTNAAEISGINNNYYYSNQSNHSNRPFDESPPSERSKYIPSSTYSNTRNLPNVPSVTTTTKSNSYSIATATIKTTAKTTTTALPTSASAPVPVPVPVVPKWRDRLKKSNSTVTTETIEKAPTDEEVVRVGSSSMDDTPTLVQDDYDDDRSMVSIRNSSFQKQEQQQQQPPPPPPPPSKWSKVYPQQPSASSSSSSNINSILKNNNIKRSQSQFNGSTNSFTTNNKKGNSDDTNQFINSKSILTHNKDETETDTSQTFDKPRVSQFASALNSFKENSKVFGSSTTTTSTGNNLDGKVDNDDPSIASSIRRGTVGTLNTNNSGGANNDDHSISSYMRRSQFDSSFSTLIGNNSKTLGSSSSNDINDVGASGREADTDDQSITSTARRSQFASAISSLKGKSNAFGSSTDMYADDGVGAGNDDKSVASFASSSVRRGGISQFVSTAANSLKGNSRGVHPISLGPSKSSENSKNEDNGGDNGTSELSSSDSHQVDFGKRTSSISRSEPQSQLNSSNTIISSSNMRKINGPSFPWKSPSQYQYKKSLSTNRIQSSNIEPKPIEPQQQSSSGRTNMHLPTLSKEPAESNSSALFNNEETDTIKPMTNEASTTITQTPSPQHISMSSETPPSAGSTFIDNTPPDLSRFRQMLEKSSSSPVRPKSSSMLSVSRSASAFRPPKFNKETVVSDTNAPTSVPSSTVDDSESPMVAATALNHIDAEDNSKDDGDDNHVSGQEHQFLDFNEDVQFDFQGTTAGNKEEGAVNPTVFKSDGFKDIGENTPFEFPSMNMEESSNTNQAQVHDGFGDLGEQIPFSFPSTTTTSNDLDEVKPFEMTGTMDMNGFSDESNGFAAFDAKESFDFPGSTTDTSNTDDDTNGFSQEMFNDIDGGSSDPNSGINAFKSTRELTEITEEKEVAWGWKEDTQFPSKNEDVSSHMTTNYMDTPMDATATEASSNLTFEPFFGSDELPIVKEESQPSSSIGHEKKLSGTFEFFEPSFSELNDNDHQDIQKAIDDIPEDGGAGMEMEHSPSDEIFLKTEESPSDELLTKPLDSKEEDVDIRIETILETEQDIQADGATPTSTRNTNPITTEEDSTSASIKPDIGKDDNVIRLKSCEILSNNEMTSAGNNSASTSMAMNPLSGNVILCRQRNKFWYIDELDPSNLNSVTLSTSVTLPQLRNKMKSSSFTNLLNQIPCGVKDVLSIAAGVHKQQGKVRVRVAAIIRFNFLVTNNDSTQGNKFTESEEDDSRETNELICAVWQWGYGQGCPVQLQSVILTPYFSPRCSFDPTTLCIADGLIFVGGTIESTELVVFIAKPTVRDSWLANKLSGIGNTLELGSSIKGGKQVVALSVTTYSHQHYRYLTIALDNGSLTVWKYDKAVTTNRRAEDGGKDAMTLDFFCQLETNKCFQDANATIMSSGDSTSRGETVAEDVDLTNRVTHVCWIPSRSYSTSLLLLAAASKHGVAIYNISFARNDNVISTISSNDSMSHNSRMKESNHGPIDYDVAPIAIAKVSQNEDDISTVPFEMKSLVSWIDFGPIMSPGILLVRQNSDTYDVFIGSLDLREVHESVYEIPLLISVCEDSFPVSSCLLNNVGFSSSLGSVIGHRDGSLTAFYPSTEQSSLVGDAPWKNSLFFSAFKLFPAVSSGVDSKGNVLSNSDFHDSSFHIYTQIDCKSAYIDGRKQLQIPVLRHWLCRTLVGDKKSKNEKKNDQNLSKGMENSDYPTGGAVTSIIGELSVSEDHLTPHRICIDGSGKICAVLYSPLFDSEKKMCKREPVSFAIFESNIKVNGSVKTKLYSGRDISFLRSNEQIQGEASLYSLLILDNDCTTLRCATFDGSRQESQKVVTKIDTPDMKWRRIFVISTGVICVGFTFQNGRECIFHLGQLDHFGQDASSALPKKSETKLWFQRGEEVLSLIELPPSQDTAERFIAISTTYRVIIVSALQKFSILTETEAQLTCDTLISLGSHCVGFLSFPTGSSMKSGAMLQYLSCLTEYQSDGVIATLPSTRNRQNPYLLLAIRPDRIVYLSSQSGTRVYDSDNSDQILTVPIALTRPISLLQPLVANALSQSKSNRKETTRESLIDELLLAAIERFGRKSLPTPYNEEEGIGTHGSGITASVYEMLNTYGYSDIISDSTIRRNPNDSAMLNFPPWIPMPTKEMVLNSYENQLDMLASGDSSLLDYLKQPDDNIPCTLPRTLDPSSIASRMLATKAMKENNVFEAMKFLDVCGTSSSDKDLLHIILSMQLTSNEGVNDLLKALCSDNRHGSQTSVSALASLALNLQDNRKVISQENDHESKQWVGQLAPSFKNGQCPSRRSRNDLLKKLELLQDNANTSPMKFASNTILKETNNVWSTGPFNDKEELLLLDSIEEWLGRCHPLKLGKEGADIAAESGERTLQQILAAANNDNESSSDSDGEDSINTFKQGWVDRIGEGRSDEDNLTLYLRLSEGADEDNRWKVDGCLKDLSTYENHVRVANSAIVNIEATTSNVDEGESGKVKLLHDMVFNSSVGHNDLSGIMVEVKRGSSLDTGVLHSSTNESRQRFSLEFWYFLPEDVEQEIVLARRSICFPGESVESSCHVSEEDGLLWELMVLTSGRLKFRTRCDSFESPMTIDEDQSDDNEYDFTESNDLGLVTWNSWNHVCLTFSCRDMKDISYCNISLLMKGVSVLSSIVSMPLPGLEKDQMSDIDLIDETLERSAIIFGLGPVSGLRITEIRCWACERSASDVKMMMYEYLQAAETKRKIKVRIRSKISTARKESKSSSLRNLSGIQKKALFAPPSSSASPLTSSRRVDSITQINDTKENEIPSFGDNNDNILQHSESATGENDSPIENFFDTSDNSVLSFPEPAPFSIEINELFLLSEEVRKSAAAALIRGPPATRHFGGNRGGLYFDPQNHPYSLRSGVNSIAICSSEKTVILNHGTTPPGRTYPIGASGAIVSDLIGDNKEYLCCFLAKDKRMVVFELHSKTVVVELQMTMKLNFWRFLPQEAHGFKLTFMLITPIGGFHWCALDESPRPIQVWKRGSTLQGKKIVAYEEGGSNGLQEEEYKSTVALLLTVTEEEEEDEKVEAWCLTLFEESTPFCFSNNVMGAALYCLPSVSKESHKSFEPCVVIVSKREMNTVLEITPLLTDVSSSKELYKGVVIAETILQDIVEEQLFSEPTLAMKSAPSTFCLCIQQHIVIIFRASGQMYSFIFLDDRLKLVGMRKFDSYIVDAAIKTGERDGDAEVVLLLCAPDSVKDGQIYTVKISKQET